MSVLSSDNKDVSVMMSEMDVNAIAGTLKLYFRELPEPLFTDEFYPSFAEGIGECISHCPSWLLVSSVGWPVGSQRQGERTPRCPHTMVCIEAQTPRVMGGLRTKPVLEAYASPQRAALSVPSK